MKVIWNVTIATILSAAVLMGAAQTAVAQDYPSRPVRVIVPYPPGGAADVLARITMQELSKRLGQTFVVENRAGGGGHIGANLVARSSPDGYTLMADGAPHAIGMTFYRKLPYDMGNDLTPIIPFAKFPSLIVVHPSLPVKSIHDLIALAKARPGDLNYGANAGSVNHMAIELFNAMGKVRMVLIGYKGAGPVVSAVIAGEIHLAAVGIPAVWPHVQAGRLRAIAVTSGTRSPSLPTVPTVSESGLPGYDVISWSGVFAPAGTPSGIIAKLHAEIAAVLAIPHVIERLEGLGAEPVPMGVDEFDRFVQRELKKWAEVVKTSGASAD